MVATSFDNICWFNILLNFRYFYQGYTPDLSVELQRAEILIPRGPGRYSWPHALLQEHLSSQLAQQNDRERIYRAAAAALEKHPLAPTRRVVRQRVMNLLLAGDAEAGAHLLFHFLQVSL